MLGLVLLASLQFAKAEDVTPDTVPTDPSTSVTQLFPTPGVLHNQAYQATTSQALPLTPAEVQKFRDMLDLTQRAQAAAPFENPPTPVTSSLMVSLAPGATPPVIRLQQGFVTSLVFMDVSGNPWVISSYDLGNPKAFNIQWEKNTNTLMLQATSAYAPGDLAVRLQGLPTPVMLTLLPGQPQVDYRVDLHVEGQAPGAMPAVTTGLPAPVSNVLLGVLNGIPPQEARTLTVIGGQCSESFHNCQAWLLGDTLYLRIPMTLLSPGFLSRIQSSDGMQAYVLEKTPSVLVSENGKAISLQIEGF